MDRCSRCALPTCTYAPVKASVEGCRLIDICWMRLEIYADNCKPKPKTSKLSKETSFSSMTFFGRCAEKNQETIHPKLVPPAQLSEDVDFWSHASSDYPYKIRRARVWVLWLSPAFSLTIRKFHRSVKAVGLWTGCHSFGCAFLQLQAELWPSHFIQPNSQNTGRKERWQQWLITSPASCAARASVQLRGIFDVFCLLDCRGSSMNFYLSYSVSKTLSKSATSSIVSY